MDTIREKIRKLLAVAEGQANEHESAQAMAMASALMMKHGINRDELGDKSSVGEGSHFPVEYKWYKIAAQAAGLLYGTVAFGNYGWTTFRFVGRPENIEASQDTLAFIILQVEALYKSHLPKGLSKADRAEFRRTFKQSCIMRVYQRCHDIVEEQKRVDAPLSDCRALVIVEHRKLLEEEAMDYINGAGGVTEKARAVKIRYTPGSVAGFAAGDAVDLHRKVG